LLTRFNNFHYIDHNMVAVVYSSISYMHIPMFDAKRYLLGVKNATEKSKFTSLAVGADGRSRVHRDVFGVVGSTGAMGCVQYVLCL
jgi:hypothetical protein